MISTTTTICVLLVLFVFGVACLSLRNKLLRNREKNLERLSEQRERLQGIISELLSRVDDIDATCKYQQLQLDRQMTHRIQDTCSKLVRLGDTLKEIDEQLHAKKDKDAGKTLVDSLESAGKLSSEIQSLRQEVAYLKEDS